MLQRQQQAAPHKEMSAEIATTKTCGRKTDTVRAHMEQRHSAQQLTLMVVYIYSSVCS